MAVGHYDKLRHPMPQVTRKQEKRQQKQNQSKNQKSNSLQVLAMLEIWSNLGKWGKAVSGTACIGNNIHAWFVCTLIYSHHKHRCISRWSRNDNLLSSTLWIIKPEEIKNNASEEQLWMVIMIHNIINLPSCELMPSQPLWRHQKIQQHRLPHTHPMECQQGPCA